MRLISEKNSLFCGVFKVDVLPEIEDKGSAEQHRPVDWFEFGPGQITVKPNPVSFLDVLEIAVGITRSGLTVIRTGPIKQDTQDSFECPGNNAEIRQ